MTFAYSGSTQVVLLATRDGRADHEAADAADEEANQHDGGGYEPKGVHIDGSVAVAGARGVVKIGLVVSEHDHAAGNEPAEEDTVQ